MTQRRRALLTLWAVVAFLTYHVVSGIRLMRLPGLQSDELLFVDIARGIYTSPEAHLLFGIPVQCFHYIGSLKSYLYSPIFAVLGVSLTTIRLPAVLISAVTLLVGFIVLRRFLPRWTALLALGLMATDPAFLCTTTLDFGPVMLMLLLKLVSLLLLVRFLSAPSTGKLVAFGVTLLIGVWDKLNFLWFAAALIVAVGLVYRRRWWPWLRANRRGWVATLVLGAAFAAFAWLAKSLANAQMMPGWEVDMPVGTKLKEVYYATKATLTLDNYRDLTGKTPPVTAPFAAWLVLDTIAVAIALFALVTERARPLRRRLLAGVTLVLAFAVALMFVQMVLTPNGIGPHHVMILWPLHQWLAVLGLTLAAAYVRIRYLARAGAGAVLVGLIGLQILSGESRLGEIELRRTFTDRWSPLVTELAAFVRSKANDVDAIIFIDYGATQQVKALCPRETVDRMRDISYQLNRLGPAEFDRIYRQCLAGRSVLIVFSAAGEYPHPAAVRNITTLLDGHSCERHAVKSWFNEQGKRVFSVMYARCPPLAGSP